MVSTRTSDAAAAVSGTSKVAKATVLKAEKSKKKAEVAGGSKAVDPSSDVLETAKGKRKDVKDPVLVEKEAPLADVESSQAAPPVTEVGTEKKGMEKAKGSKKVTISNVQHIKDIRVGVSASEKSVDSVAKSVGENNEPVESDDDKKKRGLVLYKGEWLSVDALVAKIREEALAEAVQVKASSVVASGEPVVGSVDDNVPDEEERISKGGEEFSKQSEKGSLLVGAEGKDSEEESSKKLVDDAEDSVKDKGSVQEAQGAETEQEEQHSLSEDKENDAESELVMEDDAVDSSRRSAQNTEAYEKDSDKLKVLRRVMQPYKEKKVM